ncbi:MAG: LCP family protein [Lachnospiraceae bacterium]|nr:LCP family protein [Lachnospiraceae bacterium]
MSKTVAESDGTLVENIPFPDDVQPEEQPGERPAKKKKKHSFFGTLLKILMILVILVFGALFAFYQIKLNKMYKASGSEVFSKADVYCDEEARSYLKKTGLRYQSILIYGVDARNSVDLLKNTNADTAILLVIDNLTHRVQLVSIHRDMFTERASGGSGKLTDIYAGYGIKESMDTINRSLDLHVTEYVAVNWFALAKAADLLGGIDLFLTSAEVDFINFRIEYTAPVLGEPVTYLENKGDGIYRMNGVQVVCHCSNRAVGRDDISRAERQRDVLSAMFAAAKTKDLKTLNAVVDRMLPDISTNLSALSLTLMTFDVIGMKLDESRIFPFKYIGQKDLGPSYVYCDTLISNVSELHKVLYGTEDYKPSKTVQGVSAFIDAYRAEHP